MCAGLTSLAPACSACRMTASTSGCESTLCASEKTEERSLQRYGADSCQARTRPERESQTRLQAEEGDGAILDFSTNDAPGWEAQAIAVESHCALEIVNAECDEGYVWIHRGNTHRSGFGEA